MRTNQTSIEVLKYDFCFEHKEKEYFKIFAIKDKVEKIRPRPGMTAPTLVSRSANHAVLVRLFSWHTLPVQCQMRSYLQ